ncbi:MAG: PQQ-binding-like beta-propeller repeat protein [Rubripirellula sp.]|nr:PQQ-binding-like beta-propeller repeat protein [Rubripirellula sp.]
MRIIGLGAVSLLFVLTAQAENWPGWRGPAGDGTTSTPGPTNWDGDSGKNVAWKTALPGEGHSCPIVWQDRVFVTSCLPDSQQRLLISVNREDGQILWQRTVLRSRLESKHSLNSYASSTPATDGEFVYVSFFQAGDDQIVAPNVGNERLIYPGEMVIAAYDFAGNQRWLVRPGPFISAHGFCSNPVLYGDLLIINGDHDGDSYLVALDKRTGKQVWKQQRKHRTRSYSTPLIRSVDGKDQLVLCGSLCVASFDPRSGTPIWSVDGPTEQFVASVVYDGVNFFAAGGFPTHHVMAIRPGGHGNVSETHVSWHETNVRCYVPSPVLVNKHLLVADDRGTANCFDTTTGTRLWQTRLGRHYSASLTAAAGLVYFIDDDGVTKIIRPGPKPKVIAENVLGEKVYASPAFADGQLFVRGRNHLFCIQAD